MERPGLEFLRNQYEYSIVMAVKVSVFSVPGKTSLLFLIVYETTSARSSLMSTPRLEIASVYVLSEPLSIASV